MFNCSVCQLFDYLIKRLDAFYTRSTSVTSLQMDDSIIIVWRWVGVDGVSWSDWVLYGPSL